MNKFRTHVIILSDRVLANVLPALDYNLRPEKVVLCESDAMQKRGVAHRLTGFFKSNRIKVELFKLGKAGDFASLHKKFEELSARFEKRPADVAVNLSGGTRVMSTAAQSVFAVKNFTCIYAVPQRNEMVTVCGGKMQHHLLQDKLKLNDYFSIHGCKVSAKREKNLKLMSGSHALCRELLADFEKYAKHLAYLGRLAGGAENHFSLKARAGITQDNRPVFELFQKHGFLSSFDEWGVTFASEEDRSFCKGIWLEDYLHQTLKNISKDADLQDFATCVEFESASGLYYDLDAAFICKNKLFVIEANSSRTSEGGGDELFSMEGIKDFDGKCIVPIVLSFRELKSIDLKRAERQGLQLIQSSEINQLEDKLRALIGTACK